MSDYSDVVYDNTKHLRHLHLLPSQLEVVITV